MFDPRPDLLPARPLRPAAGGWVDLAGPAGPAWAGPLWSGDPSARVVVGLSGGLGDAVRDLAFAAGLARSGLAAEVSVYPCHSSPRELPELLRWATVRAWGPDEVPEVDAAIVNAWAAPVFEGPGPRLIQATADRPALGLAARGFGVSLAALAGPVLEVPAEVADRARAEVAGDGPIVAVDLGSMPPPSGSPRLVARLAELAAEILAGAEPEPGDLDAGRARVEVARRVKYTPSVGAAVPLLLAAGVRVALVGGPGPERCPAGAVDLRGRSLCELAAVLSVVDAFVGPDSGPLHLAGILGTPSVGVFTLTDPSLHVVSARTRALVGSAPCRPCGYRFGAGPRGPFPCAGGGAFGACAEVSPAEVAGAVLDRVSGAVPTRDGAEVGTDRTGPAFHVPT